jgi:hypothetical protein
MAVYLPNLLLRGDIPQHYFATVTANSKRIT